MSPATDVLFARLSPDDLQEVRATLTNDEEALLRSAPEIDQRRLLLAFGVHHEVPEVFEKTGLLAAQPPDAVHSMGRGAMAAGGSTYYADMVIDALKAGDFELAGGARGLDFGCSSGRVVRVLSAAYPHVHWHGCDVIESSIQWAQDNLPGTDYVLSAEDPPLPWDEAYFDFAFAISIWSHFSQRAAIAWLNEMHRVLRPAAPLVITTHGYESIAHDRRTEMRSLEQLTEISEALYRHGYWYKPEYAGRGDHGIDTPDWGAAFWTSEWLLSHVLQHWTLRAFMPGRAEDNQDLYVIQRR
jgi:SAM-dependent methyltransferase